MRQALLFVLFAPAAAGCSLLYNPNNLPNPAADASADVEVILDADPSMLMVTAVAPAVINEGQGDGNSPPAMVVLAGHNMIDANFTVTATPETPLPAGSVMPTFGTPVVAKDGNWVAFTVTSKADPMLAPTDRILFDLQVSEDIPSMPGQHSMAMLTGQLALQGLPELTISMPAPITMIDTSTLAPLYSQVNLTGDVSFTGTARAIIHATSSITTQNLTASGLTGGATGATAKFVGGCAGGGPAQQGDCSGGGAGMALSGLLSGSGGGGGGGGYAIAGAAGGSGGGTAGPKTGDPLIATYDGTSTNSANQSEGGGGGGPSNLLGVSTAGGGGGTGGGSIELTAGGDVSTGTITANGGGGQAGGGGGGGGGAGGLVMLRAGNALTAGTISVNGGAAGTATGSNSAGGAGGHGRVRWDSTSGTAPAVAAPAPVGETLHRGPAFTLESYLFRSDPSTKITLTGTPNDLFTTYSINYGIDGPATSLGGQGTFGPDGNASYNISLKQGLTQLCITVMGGAQGTSEGDKCVYVAYLP